MNNLPSPCTSNSTWITSLRLRFILFSLKRQGKGRERNIEPTTWACALTGNPTGNLLVMGRHFTQGSHFQVQSGTSTLEMISGPCVRRPAFQSESSAIPFDSTPLNRFLLWPDSWFPLYLFHRYAVLWLMSNTALLGRCWGCRDG